MRRRRARGSGCVHAGDIRTDGPSLPFAAEVRRADVSSWAETMRVVKEARPSQLSRRTYGIGGFSPTALDVADAVRAHVPGARVATSWPGCEPRTTP